MNSTQLKSLTYRQLQQWLKEQRSNGKNVTVKLNSKHSVLLEAALNVLSTIEEFKTNMIGHSQRYTQTVANSHKARPYSAYNAVKQQYIKQGYSSKQSASLTEKYLTMYR